MLPGDGRRCAGEQMAVDESAAVDFGSRTRSRPLFAAHTNAGQRVARGSMYYGEWRLSELGSPIKPVINDEKIIKAIKALKDDSSAGLDGISVKILKLNIYSLIKPLSHIFNLAIATSTFPECFKISVITPIHKKGDKSNIENYRPISQISNIAKAFEKIIKKELVNYIESNNLLSCTQFGFRPGKSSEQAIATVLSYIYNSFENKKKCATVYLDLARAFDTIESIV
ncbi:Reverse transcriptase domain-containing protein [Aphis craccivora]|uniref:Reverse transcriptase domain-containing protein n=1 Tax=Aphis craccivora TaxID=307492 RepID=A0A6G0Y981_APHCR|nr:Reverse transcriptase domain-containing protein [Aphis craccivora]